MTHTRRSPWTAVAVVLALVALALAGWALWSGMQQARGSAASRAELERLRQEVDSLRALVPPPDTVIPLTGRAAPAVTGAAAPTPQTPTRP